MDSKNYLLSNATHKQTKKKQAETTLLKKQRVIIYKVYKHNDLRLTPVGTGGRAGGTCGSL